MRDGAESRQPADDRPPPIPRAPDGNSANGAYGAHGSYPVQSAYGPNGGHGAGHGYGPAPAYGAGSAYGPGQSYGPGQGYGHGYGPGHGYGWQGPPLPTGMSTSAMVLGIISLVLAVSCWGAPLGVVTSVLALCVGVSARRRVRRGEMGGQGQASAGFVMGIVGLCLSVLVSTLLAVALVSGADDPDRPGPGGGSGSDSYDARGVVATWGASVVNALQPSVDSVA